MKLYSSNDEYKLYEGNMLDMLEVIEPNSIDSIITDPPYGLTSIVKRFGKEDSAEAQYGKDGSFQRLSKGFMGKEWDGSGIEYNINAWRNCYEVLKPGGYLLAFGGSRTFHRIAVAIEDAGFEIRDTIMWLYGSGFPKSLNIGLAIDKKNGVESKVVGYADTTMPDFRDVGKKQKEISGIDKLTFGQIENSERKETPIYEAQNEWQGWGTALKPSYEPIIVARKPVENTVVDNVLKYGVGGINIDECRVGNEERFNQSATIGKDGIYNWNTTTNINDEYKGQVVNGRFPANTILTYDDTDYKEVCGGFPDTKSQIGHSERYLSGAKNNGNFMYGSINETNSYNDDGSASRYFYCAKASKKDRDDGLDAFEKMTVDDGRNTPIDNPYQRGETQRHNIHPTVKPMELMQYLIRLVTPKGGVILDPFNGSGSTGKAVMYENAEKDKGYKYIGIELTDEYLPISKARIESVYSKKTQTSLF